MSEDFQGEHGRGAVSYSKEQLKRVTSFLATCTGPRHATTAEEICAVCEINGRSLRHLFSEQDGVLFLLAFHKDEIWLAQTVEEAEEFTGRMASQARKMMARVERRRVYAKRLDQTQPGLF